MGFNTVVKLCYILFPLINTSVFCRLPAFAFSSTRSNIMFAYAQQSVINLCCNIGLLYLPLHFLSYFHVTFTLFLF